MDHTRSAWGTITHAREEGIAEGVKMGREEGIEEGVKMGREKGAHEKALEIARTLQREGMAPARIAEITGLSLPDPGG